jgi:hypothetical protein
MPDSACSDSVTTPARPVLDAAMDKHIRSRDLLLQQTSMPVSIIWTNRSILFSFPEKNFCLLQVFLSSCWCALGLAGEVGYYPILAGLKLDWARGC